MINTRYFKVVALGLLLSTASCDVLDIEPQASLPADTALTTKAGVEAGLIGAYSSLQSGNYMGLRYFLFADLMTENVNHTGTFPSFAQIKQRNILADNTEINNIWNSIYNAINRTNTLIAAIPAIEDASFNKEAALGEARFLRAYHYFNLINYFGGSPQGYGYSGGVGVPLILTPTLTAADAVAKKRATEAEVMAQVSADLDYAEANIPVSYAGGAAATKGRATKAAVLAIRSRIALYQRNYEAAATYAKRVMDEYPSFTLMPNYGDIYVLRNTAESIWELQFDPVNSNSIAFFWFPTSLGGRNEVSPSTTLAAAHTTGDTRKAVNNVSNSYTRKYTRISTSDDHVVLVRLAEVLLNRAEALTHIGGQANLEEAIVLLNRIRTRAGLAPLFVSTVAGVTTYDTSSATAIRTAILQDRRLELASEGHYWFTLRRTNNTGVENPNKNLWPIPQREVLTSGGVIAQNTDY
jgi:starch-binding outer membrane protein, SusD/RagB family